MPAALINVAILVLTLAVLDGVHCPVVCVYFNWHPYFTLFFNCCDYLLRYFPIFRFDLSWVFSQEVPVVVVVDFGNHRLVLWRLGDGTVWKQLGSQGKKPGQFNFPRAVAVTSTGALVVTDMHRVQVLTVDGAVLCLLDPTEVAGVGRLCDNLTGVTVCAGTDEILVTDFFNHRVVALTWFPPCNVHFSV